MAAVLKALLWIALYAPLAWGADKDQLHYEELSEVLQTALVPPKIPTRVLIGIKLLQIFQIDQASEEIPKLRAQFKIKIQWRDHRNETPAKGGYVVQAFQSSEAMDKLNTIFDPKIQIVDGDRNIEHIHLLIYPDGTTTISQVVNITVPANMDLKHFPFDNQIFNFRFASTLWDEETLDLILDPLETGIAEDAAPESWNIDFSSYYIAKSHVRSHSEEFQVFNFLVHATRDPRYFIWRLLLPLIVIVILSWNVFWMYEDASLALGNCFVFLLTVVAFHQIANSMLPLIPSFTFMDAIVFISYGFIIIPTFQVMITTKLENQGNKELAEKVRRYCRWAVPIIFVISLLVTTLGYFS